MSRQRIHNSRAGRSSGNSGASWISYSDLMAALVLVFVLILSMSLHQYFIMLESKTKELDQQKLLITNQQLKLDEQTLQIAAQQVTMDHQNAQIAVIMTQLDEKQTALEEAYIVLGENQAQLEEAQKTLAGKEAQLIILQQELANKETALNAAIQVLNSKTDKIEDMVGMKAEIISELSASLSRANLSAAVDKNTGDIVLDSAVLFKTNSAVIMADGKALLNRFIPVYLEVLLRPEYADYLGQIVIEGHTDDSGSYEHNMKLSQERAYEVMMYILSMYREGSQERELLQKLLTATGRSKSDLIYYEGTNIVNQAASRRVEFKFSLKDAEMIEEMNRLLQGQ